MFPPRETIEALGSSGSSLTVMTRTPSLSLCRKLTTCADFVIDSLPKVSKPAFSSRSV
ncbi:Uncharacterised protein [Mycobacteroides abscessus subsp. abscessus]|nr:Uncharacterised protein [Mycobacteroides abscessus subsp. abscessus]